MMENVFSAGLFDELESLYPDSRAEEGRSFYQTSACGGGYASVQIMLSGLTPGIPVTFQIAGPHEKYKLFELIPLPVEVNSSINDRTEWLDKQYNPYTIRRAPFSVYDIQRPCTNILTPAGVSMAVMFRCKVEGEEHRFSNWEFQVSHCNITKILRFEVEEYQVQIPPADQYAHKYINWIGEKVITMYHHAPLFSEEWYQYLERYFRLAHYGRQNMVCFWPHWFFDKNENDVPTLNEKKLDRLIEIADRTGMYYISCGTLTGRKNEEWEADSVTVKICEQEIPGEKGEYCLQKMAEALYEYIKRHELKNRWYQSFMDEPSDIQAKVYKTGTDILKKAMPDIPILEATLATKKLAGTVNIWCPVTKTYEDNLSFFRSRVKKGERIFVYTCLQPTGNYMSRLLDMEHIRQVYLGWMPMRYKDIEGFLHWGGSFLAGNDPTYLSAPLPDITDYDTSRNVVLPAGDCAILFPGFHEVLSSVRLEAHRIGLEDLALLQSIPDGEKLVSELVTNYHEYEKDIKKYRQVKQKLLKEGEKIQKK